MPHRLQQPGSTILADVGSTIIEFGLLAGYLLAGVLLIGVVLVALVARPVVQLATRLVQPSER